jgi:hypothetical protein
VGQHSSVNIATCSGLGGLVSESWGGGDFPISCTPALRPTQLPVQWALSLLSGVRRAVRIFDYPPPPKTEVKEREELYLYSPSGPSQASYRVRFTFTSHYVCCLVLKYQDTDVHTEGKKQLFPATNFSSKLSICRRHGYYNKRHFSQLRLVTRHNGDRNSITERGGEFPLLLVTYTSRPALRSTQFLIEGLFPLGEMWRVWN